MTLEKSPTSDISVPFSNILLSFTEDHAVHGVCGYPVFVELNLKVQTHPVWLGELH